jgi:5-methylcytosine-specific restriction endonuclease McrA
MLDHKKSMSLWEKTFGEATEAYDNRNRLVYKAAYGQKGSDFGWEVHHKLPKNKGGTDAYDNLQIVHVITHNEIHGR